ncbi:MAG: glycosyltransferase family 4 protein [Thermoleophilia bacterium]|nr:glycosyltransferase family 4 protein [Thermoleophilia bacterium]
MAEMVRFNLYAIKTIRQLRPSVVHLVLIQRSLIPLYLWLWTQRSLRVVVTMALSHLAYRSRVSLSTRATAWIMWQRADAIDSLYPAFVTAAGRRYRRKITVSPCSFTDTEAFRPAEQKDNVIVFSGRLIDEKNPLLLLRALISLKDMAPQMLRDWRVHILGEGPLERDVRERIVQAGLEGLVTVERVHCTSPYLRRARIFVSLQKTENYPSQSLLEAMSSGCAVIATDVGQTRRLIDEETGLLVPSDSPSELAEALLSLMVDPKRCDALGRAARERVLAEHSLARFAEYLGQLWRRSGCC